MRFYESILAVSDLQAPFQHPDALKFLAALKAKYYINSRKSLIINQGDEIDAHCLSLKFKPNRDHLSAGEEHKQAVRFLKDYWALFPEQSVCISNHTLRPYLTAQSAGLPSTMLKDFNTLLGAPKGISWRSHWVYNNICFEHGENVSGPTAAINAARQNLMSTSIGHQHSNGGVQYYQSKFKRIFGLNTGCLIDPTAYAFDYGRNYRNKETLGCGIILGCDEAHFVPMKLNAQGRWTGKL